MKLNIKSKKGKWKEEIHLTAINSQKGQLNSARPYRSSGWRQKILIPGFDLLRNSPAGLKAWSMHASPDPDSKSKTPWWEYRDISRACLPPGPHQENFLRLLSLVSPSFLYFFPFSSWPSPSVQDAASSVSIVPILRDTRQKIFSAIILRRALDLLSPSARQCLVPTPFCSVLLGLLTYAMRYPLEILIHRN